MSWFSILPDHLSFYELWLVRFFLFLGCLAIGPWAILLIYDFLLYCWRSATYKVPVVGGKARGRQRPRAPSLTERPSGLPRSFSLTGSPARQSSGSGSGSDRVEKDGPNSPKRRREGLRDT